MPWHDIAMQFKGPAVIDLQRHFCQYWYFAIRDLSNDPMDHLKNFKPINSLRETSSSSIEKYSDSDIKKDSRQNSSNFETTHHSDSNTRQSNQNMLTCVTSFLSSSSCSEFSKKTNSLVSFEQHEASSNQTKLKNNDETTQCYNMSSVNDCSLNFTENNTIF